MFSPSIYVHIYRYMSIYISYVQLYTTAHSVQEFNPTSLCLVTRSCVVVLLSYAYKSADISWTWCSSVSAVPKAADWGAGKQFFHYRNVQKFSVPPNWPHWTSSPTQRPIQCVMGGLYAWIKRPGCEAGYLRPRIAEVKNTWNYTSMGSTP
jgi:hypothetical protein